MPPSVGGPCPDEDFWYWHWGPQNQDEVPGTHTEDDQNVDPSSRGGDITFTISNIRVEGQHKAFDFQSSVPVQVIFAKGYSDDGHTTELAAPATSGTARTGDGDTTYIKHVIICPVEETPPTSSSTSSSTTSSTLPPSSSTSSSTTSSTVAPTTSSSTTAPAPTTSSTIATTTTVSSGGGLPVTGSNTPLLLGIAGVLLLAGGGFLVARRQLGNRSA